VAFRDGKLAFTGTPIQLFEDREMLKRTGLHPPASAALAERMRERNPDLPPLLTVQQWSELLGPSRDSMQSARSTDLA
jgi:hypothetical protein